ncbi:thioredoxin domain-containing protein [Pontibacter sp. BT310]|uniref:Thioredoxin domain-containing protein n=1 Tax=Pontibacter populi TaxID=890055 RepID=A0ABS6X720_9BACT|nr:MULTISPECIES: thioredoxin domain-containing protein [Pontibacter]MBJ6116935.1 thioredoxin domain-containing protein [Pontibacter sp. BT310]MBR0569359.1 thioredoxin domain-containing protein [Microvirga sp. STS03]MBW3363788.1 thioredoxin domain-containing protein [Pontibacter populi]
MTPPAQTALSDRKPNRLIKESSPYLLQHAYNPVDWYPWGEEALQQAKQENKPILVSIGYAACHWCHVMEHQSFERQEISDIMNQHFICIKVDREERPDVDAVYIDAVHAMGLQGGWPLNVFLTSEAKPFYGGTYFAPQQWAQLLQNIANAYKENRQELDETAEQFVEHLNVSDLEKYGLKQSDKQVSEEELQQLYLNLSKRFDKIKGGLSPAPKFPMPSNFLFLLRYIHHTQSETALAQVNLTLSQMAYGGIYDQVGGGFARYAVDADWLVPHFEKMLYDNAQLVTLYAEAYQVTRDPLYKQVVYETIAFVERELMSEEYGFYSSLDADSEGEEGRFYTFTRDDLQKILKDEEPLFSKYYNVTAAGNFEHGRNILHRQESDETFARDNELELEVLQEMVAEWKRKLMKVRAKRIRPALDDKILCSWNALMLKALVDAYHVFGEKHFLDLALKNADFLFEKIREGNKLCHNYKNGKATIDGFLEDYALLVAALIRLYEVTFNEEWLNQAKRFTDYTLSNFMDKQEGMFYFTDQTAEKLIARKKEIFDNVIPSSNSAMAINLHLLGLYFDNETYQQVADKMLNTMIPLITKEPSHLSNWAILYYNKLTPTAEVAIVGKQVTQMREELSVFYLPNMILMGSNYKSKLPLLADKIPVDGKTTIYVCYNKTCQLPVHTPSEALKQLQGWQQQSKFPAL